MGNILVGQSGGPTAVINASLYGVLAEARRRGDTAFGMVHGIEGFLDDKVINLSEYGDRVDLSQLRYTPAAFLGSCRYRLPADLNDPAYAAIFAKLAKYQIDAFFYIGGNDSMDTVAKLSAYAQTVQSPVRFLGIPKTIDNDLILTDHTPGFGSTAKYVAATVREIAWDAGVYAQPVVTIVELMGRNAGWVTASSILARTEYEKNPLLVYLPEVSFDVDEFIADLRNAMKLQPSVVVCVSEGIKDKNGKLICEYHAESVLDRFGHKMLAGCGKVLEGYVKKEIGCKCRSVEINLPQRCSGTLASAQDAWEAEAAGKFAVEKAGEGATGQMVAFRRLPGEYRIEYELVPVTEVCNKEKTFPKAWIVGGHDVADTFLDYVKPLIQGESALCYQGGLPELLKPAYMK